MKKDIRTLYKALDFNNRVEYYEYLIDSHINGNFSQSRNLFNDMKRADQKDFIMYVSDKEEIKDVRNFYFNLL